MASSRTHVLTNRQWRHVDSRDWLPARNLPSGTGFSRHAETLISGTWTTQFTRVGWYNLACCFQGGWIGRTGRNVA
jgi:hypothetical protein